MTTYYFDKLDTDVKIGLGHFYYYKTGSSKCAPTFKSVFEYFDNSTTIKLKNWSLDFEPLIYDVDSLTLEYEKVKKDWPDLWSVYVLCRSAVSEKELLVDIKDYFKIEEEEE